MIPTCGSKSNRSCGSPPNRPLTPPPPPPPAPRVAQIFPPQVLSELQLNLRLGASERSAVVAQEFEGCTFLFAKLVGLKSLVEEADPRRLLELLQTTFDKFDTLAETFSVQRVRKTVNESYMVAAGLPDPLLLKSPLERAMATAGFGLALCGVMDVVNAQMADLWRASGRPAPTLDVQVGINSGSAIAGVIGHRRIQYDLVGDAVNTAARMCSNGAPGRVNVSAATYEHLRPSYLATAREPMQIKGKGIMTMYFLERRRSPSDAPVAAPAATAAAATATPSSTAAAKPLAAPPEAAPFAPLEVASRRLPHALSVTPSVSGGNSSSPDAPPMPRRSSESSASKSVSIAEEV